MNSTTKSLSLKILLSIVMVILIQQSIAICQISSEFTHKNHKTFDLLVGEKINNENDEFYNFINRSKMENEYWISDDNDNEVSNSSVTSDLYCKEETENNMIIEDWMIQEFNVDKCLKDASDKEEEMALEDWMTQPSHWNVKIKPLSLR